MARKSKQNQVQQKQVNQQANSQQAELGKGKDAEVVASAMAGIMAEEELDEKSELQKTLEEKISLERFGTPDDVANVVLFLSSGLSDYITGETIHVNGGMYFSWHYNINIY